MKNKKLSIILLLLIVAIRPTPAEVISEDLEVQGDVTIDGTLKIGELYYSALQTINLSVGTERWVKLATIPNNHMVRFQLRSGSANSEEVAEIKVLGTYHNSSAAISVERQTYNEHLREVRLVGVNGGSRTVYIKIRATSYAPSVQWRALDSKGVVTIHNVEETPVGGLAHLVSGNLVNSTNLNLVTTGSVGIGTSAPNQNLSVNGNMTVGTTGSYIMMGLSAYTGGGGYLQIQSTGSNGRDLNLKNYSNASGWQTNLFIAGETGNVGVGTITPSHKLAVNGTIRAKEVIVDTGWADYVFAEDYRLMPLSEVEAHIDENGHLPGIPTAEDVHANGVGVGEAQSLFLAKLEELTLHLIAQEKRIAALEAENAILKNQSQF